MDDLSAEPVEFLETAFSDAYNVLFRPDRLLPQGISLRLLAANDLGQLTQYAEGQLTALLDTADRQGVGHVLWSLAACGREATPDWWGSESWPFIVDRFLHYLDNPNDAWWQRARVVDQPSGVRDRAALRHGLLCRPHTLEHDVVDYCLRAGIGQVRP